MMDFKHRTVLLEESVNALHIKDDAIYIDGTLGGGGHSELILKQLKSGVLIGLDRDIEAIKATEARLAEYDQTFKAVKSNFVDFDVVLNRFAYPTFDGLLLDLGVSSHQLDTASRGFSYQQDGLLDMRMDQNDELTAADIVNRYSTSELEQIISDYGEERWARRIAEFIVKEREIEAIETSYQLVAVIKKAIPKSARKAGPHPAKRTFQAIRIAVNNELQIIEKTIDKAVERLNIGGRIAIISFHSLEDRIVKHSFKKYTKSCSCPPEAPICTCNTVKKLKIITKKPILPTPAEIEANPRARSAKLRIAERI